MKWLSFFFAGCLLMVALVASNAGLANNVVSASHSNKRVTTRTIPELLPPECASVAVTAYILGVAGTATSELIMGTSGADTMTGSGGNDCLMGGAGVDSLNGGAGTDVCFSGPGADTFHPSCEFQYQ